jgi:LytS/YehU family sensor histidine kinase
MLYQNKTEMVLLEKELSYIKNYIELERLRFKNPDFLNLSIDGDYENIRIHSMLFVPFVENAFKHSVDSDIEAGITISFSCKSNRIVFSCRNIYSADESDKDNTHGIGLATVKRRLQLMYPDRHRLRITTNHNEFIVTLEIDTCND